MKVSSTKIDRTNGWQQADLSRALSSNPMIRDRLFYTVPKQLIEAIQVFAGPGALDPALLSMELKLADVSGRHDAQVGFWNGRSVLYSHLHLSPSLTQIADARPGDWDQHSDAKEFQWLNNAATLSDADKMISWADEVGRGYCGWLTTNAQFLQEHDAFFAAWHETIRPRASMPSIDHTSKQHVAEEVKSFIDAYLALCSRWQLAGLAAPGLPIPLGPQFPVADVSLMPYLAAAGGTLLYLPNTYPVPDRALLRQMLESAMSRHRAPEQLNAWSELVSASHPGKSSIARHGRLFQLQHYWRILQRRHGRFLKGHREDLMKAMVVVLFPGENDPEDESSEIYDLDNRKFESVKKDLDQLSKALGGSDWYLRPSATDHF